MLYMKIFDDYEAERLEELGTGKIIDPYDALMEEYIDDALDFLEGECNLTKEERDDIAPKLYEESHDIAMSVDEGLGEAYTIARYKLEELRGEK